MSEREFELYDRLEAHHWWFRARRDILEVLLAEIPERARRSVLEVGCGSGGNLSFLFGGFARRVGVERDRAAVAYARPKLRGRAEIVHADANALPFPDRVFDCVAVLDVLCHRGIGDLDAVLAEIRRVLVPGGHLLIADGAFDFLAGAHSASVNATRRFTCSGLAARLQRLGFEVVRDWSWGVLLFFLLFVKRALLERALPATRGGADGERFDLVEVPVVDDLLYHAVSVERHILRRGRLPLRGLPRPPGPSPRGESPA